MKLFGQLLLCAWASPTSIIALVIGMAGLPFGTRLQRRGSTLEFHGGLVEWILERTPIDAVAMTLGHVIWGRSVASLDFSREHELVHVRQYERWGPFFLPMYFLFSLTMWLRGKNPYYDNPFEREAYGDDHPHYRSADAKPES